MDAVYPPAALLIQMEHQSKLLMSRRLSDPYVGTWYAAGRGIEMMVNLVNISYCALKILPYKEGIFSQYKDVSVQEFRFALSEQVFCNLTNACILTICRLILSSSKFEKSVAQISSLSNSFSKSLSIIY